MYLSCGENSLNMQQPKGIKLTSDALLGKLTNHYSTQGA